MYSAIGLFVALCALSQVNSLAIGQNLDNVAKIVSKVSFSDIAADNVSLDNLTKIVSNVSSSDVAANETWTVPMVGETAKFLARSPGGKRPAMESNAGDLIYSVRKPNDMLLIRDIFVPDTVEKSRRDLFWHAIIPGREITQVRALNFGDEKAFATKIKVNKGHVHVYFTVKAESDPRVIFEVYGFAEDQ